MISESTIARARTLLYAPGHRPDRFSKAAESGADAIVLDLEDSVAPTMKETAQENVRRWFAEGGCGVVRINSAGSPWYDEDLAILSERRCAVILPKAASAAQVVDVLDRLPANSCVLPLIETACGVLAAREICAIPGVVRAIFGSADLARELGISHADRTAMLRARCEVVLASAACGLAAPIDGVTSSLNDEQKIIDDVRHAVALGFGGKSCLHPRQVSVVHAALAPSEEDLEWAREVLATAYDGSVHTLRGEVIGKPVVDRARWLVSQANGSHPRRDHSGGGGNSSADRNARRGSMP